MREVPGSFVVHCVTHFDTRHLPLLTTVPHSFFLFTISHTQTHKHTTHSGGDCFLLESIFEAEVWGFMCDPISEPNEAAVCAAMVEGAREALAGYCSSIEEDLGLLRGGGGLEAGSRQELAVQVGGGRLFGGGVVCVEEGRMGGGGEGQQVSGLWLLQGSAAGVVVLESCGR